MHSLCNAYV